MVYQGEREIAAYNKKLGMFDLTGIEYCLDIVDRMLSGRHVSVNKMMEWFVEHHDYPDVLVQDADRNRKQWNVSLAHGMFEVVVVDWEHRPFRRQRRLRRIGASLFVVSAVQ
jgi:hypothetical protein